ncbi:hypothetical protein [Halorubellus salinus]|uniref:hypothetical protein n=1 Tax=Halorubellus salinus TaxID=755309 RepID=UPI001D09750F|nr:hypothetical protein [Halorubellus salinus]
MTTGGFDSEDAPGFAAIVLGAIGLTEIGTISIYGFSLSDTAFSLGSTAVTWAALLVVAGAVWISITNEVAIGDWIGMVSDGDDPQNQNKNLETAPASPPTPANQLPSHPYPCPSTRSRPLRVGIPSGDGE